MHMHATGDLMQLKKKISAITVASKLKEWGLANN